MKFSLRTKLTAAFLAVTLILFGLISVFTNYILESQFKDYVIAQQELKNAAMVSSIEGRYSDFGGKWDIPSLEAIGVSALSGGLMMRVMDQEDKVLWDAMIHNSGMCAAIIQNMGQMMQSRDSNFQGGYVEKTYPLRRDGSTFGTVAIGYYGPYAYSANDIKFLDTLNGFMRLAAVISAVLSLILGIYMARQLSVPIKRVMKVSRQIAKGNFEDRIKETSTTSEIFELAGTINSLAETLEKQEALRKRLTSDVAHELRTPLATLQSHIEAMLDGVWELDAARLTSCHEETQRLSKIVNSLEQLTRYESENLILDKKHFVVTELIKRTAINFESVLKAKGISLDIKGADQDIFADEDKISQILVNLIANAIKYTPEGGTITIDTAGSEKQVTITVSDTGIGISPSDLPNIFERFFRADQSRTQNTGGSGIGLAIVKSLVNAHHGRIEAESEVGKGSSFHIHLPRCLSH